MFTTNVFDYTNILDKAADASWMRENVITNNIANIDTPGYKRQDVDFESVLQKALGKTKYSSLDKKVRELNQDLGKLTTTSYTDAANYSYRLDRNNVDTYFYEHLTATDKRLKMEQRMESIWDYFRHLISAQVE